MMNAAADFYWTDNPGLVRTLIVHHPTIAHEEALMTKQTTDATFTRLRELHQEYVEKVGHLMTDDREDLVPRPSPATPTRPSASSTTARRPNSQHHPAEFTPAG